MECVEVRLTSTSKLGWEEALIAAHALGRDELVRDLTGRIEKMPPGLLPPTLRAHGAPLPGAARRRPGPALPRRRGGIPGVRDGAPGSQGPDRARRVAARRGARPGGRRRCSPRRARCSSGCRQGPGSNGSTRTAARCDNGRGSAVGESGSRRALWSVWSRERRRAEVLPGVRQRARADLLVVPQPEHARREVLRRVRHAARRRRRCRPPPAPAPAAERRLVSVLFADLVGFTTLSESRDSEEVRELLSALLRRAASG